MSALPVIEMQAVAVGSMHDASAIVVEQINWTVQPGDFWAVAGLQGSGKSDFMMMTGSLMPPRQGRYRLFGEEMPIFDEERLAHRLRLGLVFETGQLFNHLTVRENIALPLRYHRNLSKSAADSAVQKMLDAIELAPWADSTPGAMGRNWQKRVGLARALMLEPEVLLLDNPLAGLDLRHLNWWLTFLDRLSKGFDLTGGRPMTLVVTTADLARWKGRARQFAILKNKHFAVLGSWDQVGAASQELVQELLA
jgi:ABC-type transporter Mla maintaining outer membrane lipid asymmetry ATPase subunit MlaF